MIRSVKDAFAAKAARTFLQDRLERYGELQDLRIDSKAGRLEAVFHLKGEPQAISVHVDRYEIEEADGNLFLRLRGCHCARPWLQNLLVDWVEPKRFPLPSWAAAALR